MIQDFEFSERLIGTVSEYYLRAKMGKFNTSANEFTLKAMSGHLRYISDPATNHSGCGDYRATAGIDLLHDKADLTRRLECPVLPLWGAKRAMHKDYDVLAAWRKRALVVVCNALPCGHYLPKEVLEKTEAKLARFLVS